MDADKTLRQAIDERSTVRTVFSRPAPLGSMPMKPDQIRRALTAKNKEIAGFGFCRPFLSLCCVAFPCFSSAFIGVHLRFQTLFKVVAGGGVLLLAQAVMAADASNARFGFGSTPSEEELARFISPLPDGRGMPAGSGTVARGKTIYDAQCAACHGAKLEGVGGDRLIGGRGTLAGNDAKKAPIKTVESYWPYATTLFDYIKRAMPLTTPGSLSNDDVYAVSAYILNQAKIIPDDAVLNGAAMAKIRMPNRDGFIPDPRPERFQPARARAPTTTTKAGKTKP